MKHDTNTIVKMAGQRANTYGRIIGTLMTLPGPAFLESIRSQESRFFLETYASLQQPSITRGCRLVLGFLDQRAGRKGKEAQEVLEQMAVDRTRLIRAPFGKAYAPPYEAHYGEGDANASQLALRQLYHGSGFLPAEEGEAPDYFAIQLDFLRVLILDMVKNPQSIPELLAVQKQFLERHPGSWIKKYVAKAAPHGETDFYTGWLYIMEGFLELEKEYLDHIQDPKDWEE